MSGRKRKLEGAAGPDAVVPALSNEEIARRAWEIYMARGAEPGHDLENWLQAEKSLLEEIRRAEASRRRP